MLCNGFLVKCNRFCPRYTAFEQHRLGNLNGFITRDRAAGLSWVDGMIFITGFDSNGTWVL